MLRTLKPNTGQLILLALIPGTLSVSAEDDAGKKPAPPTTSSSPVALAVYLPATRLDRSKLTTPVLVEYQANEELLATRRVCLSERSKQLYDAFVASLDKPPTEDPRIPDLGDGLWLTYRTVERLPTKACQLEYISPYKFVSIEPGQTGYAKFGLVTPTLDAGKVELQAHLILDKKVVAESAGIVVPVDDAKD